MYVLYIQDGVDKYHTGVGLTEEKYQYENKVTNYVYIPKNVAILVRFTSVSINTGASLKRKAFT